MDRSASWVVRVTKHVTSACTRISPRLARRRGGGSESGGASLTSTPFTPSWCNPPRVSQTRAGSAREHLLTASHPLTGLLSLLDEPEAALQAHALRTVNARIDTFWTEVADHVVKMCVLSSLAS